MILQQSMNFSYPIVLLALHTYCQVHLDDFHVVLVNVIVHVSILKRVYKSSHKGFSVENCVPHTHVSVREVHFIMRRTSGPIYGYFQRLWDNKLFIVLSKYKESIFPNAYIDALEESINKKLEKGYYSFLVKEGENLDEVAHVARDKLIKVIIFDSVTFFVE